jgi:sporulation protein YlmC with PRC-barrel domain
MRFVGTAISAGTIGISFLLAEGGWMLEGAGQSAEIERASPRTSHRLLFGYSRFGDFREMKVENVDGQKIGRINDVILETRSGRPAYVVVKSSGFTLGHGRFVIVPTSAIAFRTAKVGIAALDLTRQQWRRAPEFSRKDLASLGQPERARQISQFYRLVEEAPAASTGTAEQKAGLRSTGRAEQTISSRANKTYALANDLIGSEVMARQQIAIGKISDVLVDFSGTKPTFAIVSAERLSGTGARFAVPLRLLRFMPDGTVAVMADRQNFDHAGPFRDSDLQNSARSEGDEIYRYERQERN